MKVWLDDERPAPPGWRRARTVGDAIALLITDRVDEISLDHDLGTWDGHVERTGYDVLLWLERELDCGCCLSNIPKLRIHTANPPARKRMEAAVAAIERAMTCPP